MKINFHTVVSEETESYFRYMFASTKNMSKNPENILFNVYHMSEKVDKDFLDFCIKNKIKIYAEDCNIRGSRGHAYKLSIAIKNFVENEINVISDVDVAICDMFFDEWIVKTLEEYDIVGTRYEEIGGPCVGNVKKQTYKGLPNTVWCAFTNRKDFKYMEFSADNGSNFKIETEEHSQITNLPIGYTWLKDCSWEIAKYIFDNKYKTYAFYKSNPYDDKSPQGFSSNVITRESVIKIGENEIKSIEEYQKHDGSSFLVHQRSARKLLFKENIKSKSFYNAYEDYIKKIKGEYDKS